MAQAVAGLNGCAQAATSNDDGNSSAPLAPNEFSAGIAGLQALLCTGGQS